MDAGDHDGWTRVSTKKKGREIPLGKSGDIFSRGILLKKSFLNKRYLYHDDKQTEQEKITEHTEQEKITELRPSEKGESENSKNRKRKAEQEDRLLRHTLEQEQKKINNDIDAIETLNEDYAGICAYDASISRKIPSEDRKP